MPSNRTPWWVWSLIVGVPSLPVLVQVWVTLWPPAGTAATGLSIGDSIVFTHCMRMFVSDFFMPYTSALATEGTHHAAVYLVPLHAIYGFAGAVGYLLHIPEMVVLHSINTLGGAAYLYAAYRLMTEVRPRLANLAFALFVLGGGLGGWAYLAARVTGWDVSPSFETEFMRFARYELIEGARLAPSLATPRLYYTLALAACMGGLAAFVRWRSTASRAALLTTIGLLAFGSFLNIRLAPPLLLAGILCMLTGAGTGWSLRRAARETTVLAVPIIVGCLAAWRLYMLNPSLVRETVGNIRSNMAFSAFVAATCFHWLVLPGQIRRMARGLALVPRIALFASCGYLVAFVSLYAAYQAYYGTWIQWVDFTASVAVSDWALVGGVLGAIAAFLMKTRSADEVEHGDQWMVLWLLALTVAALAAFGHGWYIRFTPDRLMAFMGVPLSMATAAGITHLAERRKRLATVVTALLVASGVCSTCVAWAVFQGPLGYHGGGDAFAWTHAELMSAADARLFERVEPAMVMAPADLGPCMGDVATLRPGVSTVFGYGSFAFSDRPINEARAEAEEFYTATTTPERRLAIARKWGVRYVLCPDTHPVADGVTNALRNEPWLRETATDGRGLLFEAHMNMDEK